MNLEYVLYDHFTPHLLKIQKEIRELEEHLHIPHMPPMEDDGAYAEDED